MFNLPRRQEVGEVSRRQVCYGVELRNAGILGLLGQCGMGRGCPNVMG